MQRALAAGIITAILCPAPGMFIVIRRQSLLGDGLGHIAFAGVTGGYLLGIYPAVAAVIVTVLGCYGHRNRSPPSFSLCRYDTYHIFMLALQWQSFLAP